MTQEITICKLHLQSVEKSCQILIHKRISLDYSLTRRLELSNANLMSEIEMSGEKSKKQNIRNCPNSMRNAVAVDPVARMLWKITDQ
jgi:hypothetical protein